MSERIVRYVYVDGHKACIEHVGVDPDTGSHYRYLFYCSDIDYVP